MRCILTAKSHFILRGHCCGIFFRFRCILTAKTISSCVKCPKTRLKSPIRLKDRAFHATEIKSVPTETASISMETTSDEQKCYPFHRNQIPLNRNAICSVEHQIHPTKTQSVSTKMPFVSLNGAFYQAILLKIWALRPHLVLKVVILTFFGIYFD